jgi:hypothetical protein
MIYRGYKLERDPHGWTIYHNKRVVSLADNQDKAMNWVDGEIRRLADKHETKQEGA